jgi:hypothetical protein
MPVTGMYTKACVSPWGRHTFTFQLVISVLALGWFLGYRKGTNMATVFRRKRRAAASHRCYYSRFVVPVDLQAILSRKEILKSLRTSEYKDASLKAAQW